MTAVTRVLLSWEHGRNLGHVTRLAELALRLRHAGADIVWALPRGAAGADRLALAGEAVHPTPEPPYGRHISATAPNSFADILAAVGFSSDAWLAQAVGRWLGLMRTERIDALVLDYAPSAQLAALIAGVAAYQITNGFDAPPSHCPLFGLTVQGPMLEARNQTQVRRIDQAIAATSAAHGGDRDATLRDLLEYPRRWYDCIAATDPYGPRQDGVYVGPVGHPTGTIRLAWPERPATERVLVYLRSNEALRGAIDHLLSREASVICCAPDLDDSIARRYKNASVQLTRRPVEFEGLLHQCHLAINYGSSAMVCRMALAGVPQVMVPTDAEKWMVARAAHAAKVGVLASTHSAMVAAISAERREDARYTRAGSEGVAGSDGLAKCLEELIARNPSWWQPARRPSSHLDALPKAATATPPLAE